MSKEESLIVKGVAILMMLYLHLFNQMTNVAICDNMIFIGNMPFTPDFDKMCTYKITYPNFQAFSKNNLCKWVTQRLFFVSLHHVCT